MSLSVKCYGGSGLTNNAGEDGEYVDGDDSDENGHHFGPVRMLFGEIDNWRQD